jgi:hypothetical protein
VTTALNALQATVKELDVQVALVRTGNGLRYSLWIGPQHLCNETAAG